MDQEKIRVTTEAIRALVGWLSAPDRERVFAALHLTRPRRATDAHLDILELFDQCPMWSVSDIKTAMAKTAPDVTAKQISNVLGYLTRRRRLHRMSYGLYRLAGNPELTAGPRQ